MDPLFDRFLMKGELAHALKSKKSRLQYGWFILHEESLIWIADENDFTILRELNLENYELNYVGQKFPKGFRTGFVLNEIASKKTHMFCTRNRATTEKWTAELERLFLRISIKKRLDSEQQKKKKAQDKAMEDADFSGMLFVRPDGTGQNVTPLKVAMKKDVLLFYPEGAEEGDGVEIRLNDCFIVNGEPFKTHDGKEYTSFCLRDIFTNKESLFYCESELVYHDWYERLKGYTAKPTAMRGGLERSVTPDILRVKRKGKMGNESEKNLDYTRLKAEYESSLKDLENMQERMRLYERSIDSYENELENGRVELAKQEKINERLLEEQQMQMNEMLVYRETITNQAEYLCSCYEEDVIELVLRMVVARVSVENGVKDQGIWEGRRSLPLQALSSSANSSERDSQSPIGLEQPIPVLPVVAAAAAHPKGIEIADTPLEDVKEPLEEKVAPISATPEIAIQTGPTDDLQVAAAEEETSFFISALEEEVKTPEEGGFSSMSMFMMMEDEMEEEVVDDPLLIFSDANVTGTTPTPLFEEYNSMVDLRKAASVGNVIEELMPSSYAKPVKTSSVPEDLGDIRKESAEPQEEEEKLTSPVKPIARRISDDDRSAEDVAAAAAAAAPVKKAGAKAAGKKTAGKKDVAKVGAKAADKKDAAKAGAKASGKAEAKKTAGKVEAVVEAKKPASKEKKKAAPVKKKTPEKATAKAAGKVEAKKATAKKPAGKVEAVVEAKKPVIKEKQKAAPVKKKATAKKPAGKVEAVVEAKKPAGKEKQKISPVKKKAPEKVHAAKSEAKSTVKSAAKSVPKSPEKVKEPSSKAKKAPEPEEIDSESGETESSAGEEEDTEQSGGISETASSDESSGEEEYSSISWSGDYSETSSGSLWSSDDYETESEEGESEGEDTAAPADESTSSGSEEPPLVTEDVEMPKKGPETTAVAPGKTDESVAKLEKAAPKVSESATEKVATKSFAIPKDLLTKPEIDLRTSVLVASTEKLKLGKQSRSQIIRIPSRTLIIDNITEAVPMKYSQVADVAVLEEETELAAEKDAESVSLEASPTLTASSDSEPPSPVVEGTEAAQSGNNGSPDIPGTKKTAGKKKSSPSKTAARATAIHPQPIEAKKELAKKLKRRKIIDKSIRREARTRW